MQGRADWRDVWGEELRELADGFGVGWGAVRGSDPQVCGLGTWKCEEIVLWRSFSNLSRSHGVGGEAGIADPSCPGNRGTSQFLGLTDLLVRGTLGREPDEPSVFHRTVTVIPPCLGPALSVPCHAETVTQNSHEAF